ncbi:site-specific integrase [Streptosporangium sp. NBC_01469]|uniref:site-specific integrase n=1 Tax=Streptosporangium sp. NBC_01469 TaxID=2903898 RepID=UPI002E2A4B89|nr:site-specific integrase [Streptosporangium sp. NBC_01469]
MAPAPAGRRGRLSVDGVTDIVRAVGKDADLPGLRPYRLRHTYATRLREAGADHAQVQALLGHTSIGTTARYFRASPHRSRRTGRPRPRLLTPKTARAARPFPSGTSRGRAGCTR